MLCRVRIYNVSLNHSSQNATRGAAALVEATASFAIALRRRQVRAAAARDCGASLLVVVKTSILTRHAIIVNAG